MPNHIRPKWSNDRSTNHLLVAVERMMELGCPRRTAVGSLMTLSVFYLDEEYSRGEAQWLLENLAKQFPKIIADADPDKALPVLN